MGTKRQTSSGLPEQLSFDWEGRGYAGHGTGSNAVSGAAGQVVEQGSTAEERTRALKQDLMEKVAEEANLLEALRRVCANKGSAGVDGMGVTELKAWMSVRANREKLRDKLISDEYEPAPVRGVQIPKPGGKGVRQLGIPTVVDRLVQQALLQVLEPIYEPTFSEGSYGFRPGRGAHDALRQASQYVAEGRSIVVDLDLEKFLDPYSYYTLVAETGSKSSGWLSKTRMRKPFCLPRLTWTTESSPRFTRCMIVWRETPRTRMACGMAT